MRRDSIWAIAVSLVPTPDSVQGEQRGRLSFQLAPGEQRIGPHIQCLRFSSGCPNDWLLFCLFWSTNRIQHTLATRGPVKTKMVVWFSVQIVNTAHPPWINSESKGKKIPSSQLCLKGRRSWIEHPTIHFSGNCLEELASVSLVLGHWWDQAYCRHVGQLGTKKVGWTRWRF